MCVCTVIDHRWRHSVKDKKVRHETKSSGATVLFTRCDVFCDLLQYTDTEKYNLYVLYSENVIEWFIDFGGMKKEKQVR